MLELGKDLLDGVQVRAVRWQEHQFCSGVLNDFSRSVVLVRGEVVEDDDIAGRQFGGEELLGIGPEDRRVHGAVDGQRCDEAVMAQASDESGGLPVTVGCLGDQALPAGCPAVARGHVGRRAHFVEEDQPCRVEGLLLAYPEPAGKRDVATVLLTGEQRFF